MKKKMKELQQEFETLFKKFLKEKNVEFIGCLPNKNYPNSYKACVTEKEQSLLQEKSDIVKQQNYLHYTQKCQDLIDQADNDSFCKASANLMLSSGLEYLEDLRKKYQDKLSGSDLNLLDEPNLNVDEDKVNEIIDTIRNQGTTNHVSFDN